MLQLSQGNSYNLTYNVKNEDGTTKVLEGTLELKYELSNRKQNLPIIQYSLSDVELNITDAANGVIVVTLNNTVLNQLKEGSHYHEIWQVNAIGQATTLMAEKLGISSKLIKE